MVLALHKLPHFVNWNHFKWHLSDSKWCKLAFKVMFLDFFLISLELYVVLVYSLDFCLESGWKTEAQHKMSRAVCISFGLNALFPWHRRLLIYSCTLLPPSLALLQILSTQSAISYRYTPLYTSTAYYFKTNVIFFFSTQLSSKWFTSDGFGQMYQYYDWPNSKNLCKTISWKMIGVILTGTRSGYLLRIFADSMHRCSGWKKEKKIQVWITLRPFSKHKSNHWWTQINIKCRAATVD